MEFEKHTINAAYPRIWVISELIFSNEGLEVSFNLKLDMPMKEAEEIYSKSTGKVLKFERKNTGSKPNETQTSPSVMPLRATGTDLIPSFELLLNDGIGWGGRTRTCE